ncbi:hypothetical protein CXF72_15780 [Psychromonas sp. MB-3u-54]|nr:hypothetical protein CXF72_15780 [Psychromonas sp. MB-3u-54]
MSIIKQASLFTVFLIIFGFILRYYSIYDLGVNINFLSIAINVLIAGLIGGAGFYLGQLIGKESLAIKHLAFSAALVFLISHTLSYLLGLYQISWFAYVAVVFTAAFIAALRIPKIFNKAKHS